MREVRPLSRARGVLARYAELLPVTSATPALSLQEGDTPLLPVPRLAEWAGVAALYVKFEGMNPTGSFKDRGMVVAVAKAVEGGARIIMCASTGNTAASAAAYAARAGVTAVVLLPRGKVAGAKVSQALAYGARAIALDTGFDAALDVARGLTSRYAVELVNSVNPHRIAGQATAAYEICDVLGHAPDVLALPVGNGGNISAYWAGFRRYRELGRSASSPVARPRVRRHWSSGTPSSRRTRSRARSGSAGPRPGSPRSRRRRSRAESSAR
jgi:threonine synthase